MHWSSVASVLTFPLFGAFVLAIVGSVLGHVLDWTLSRDWQSSFRMRVTYHAVATACLAGALVLEPTGGGAFIYMTF